MRSLFLVLSLLLLADTASGQRHRPIAEKGDLALTAQISGLSDFSIAPALGGIGLRYRLGDRSVLGTSVGFNVQSSDRDGSGTGFESTSNGANVSVWTEQHVGGRRRAISPFLAFGVQGRYSQRTTTRSSSTTICTGGDCETGIVRDESEVDLYRLGVGAGLGAEVRIVRGVTLGAAYTLGASYTWEDNDERSIGVGEPRENSFSNDVLSAGTSLSSFFLSVYF